MAKVVKHKPKAEQKPHEIARKRDDLALARLIYDIWKEERSHGTAK